MVGWFQRSCRKLYAQAQQQIMYLLVRISGRGGRREEENYFVELKALSVVQPSLLLEGREGVSVCSIGVSTRPI